MPELDDSLFDPKLREAVAAAWKDPENFEARVKALWKEVAPGVFMCQFLDPVKLEKLRAYLEKAAEANIPTRPPYGIVLNRKGFMLDQRSVGYLAIPQFQDFYQNVLDSYMRPIARLLFPEFLTPAMDSESFGFSIQYQAATDKSIRPHSDASSITLNFNLNLPSESFTGSSLYFYDNGQTHTVEFAPGVAVMHRGATMHAALPIESGQRTNMVLWLYGKHGQTSTYPHGGPNLSPRARWTKPEASNGPVDKWSPF